MCNEKLNEEVEASLSSGDEKPELDTPTKGEEKDEELGAFDKAALSLLEQQVHKATEGINEALEENAWQREYAEKNLEFMERQTLAIEKQATATARLAAATTNVYMNIGSACVHLVDIKTAVQNLVNVQDTHLAVITGELHNFKIPLEQLVAAQNLLLTLTEDMIAIQGKIAGIPVDRMDEQVANMLVFQWAEINGFRVDAGSHDQKDA